MLDFDCGGGYEQGSVMGSHLLEVHVLTSYGIEGLNQHRMILWMALSCCGDNTLSVVCGLRYSVSVNGCVTLGIHYGYTFIKVVHSQ